MEISVLFPTKRKYSLELAFYVLSYQTLPKDKFEFIIMDNLDREEQAKNLQRIPGLIPNILSLINMVCAMPIIEDLKFRKGNLW